MFHIIGAFAESERDVIAQSTSLGMNQKAKKGHAEFRAPFGYFFEEGRLRVQEAEAEIVRAIFKIKLQARLCVESAANTRSLTTPFGGSFATRSIWVCFGGRES